MQHICNMCNTLCLCHYHERRIKLWIQQYHFLNIFSTISVFIWQIEIPSKIFKWKFPLKISDRNSRQYISRKNFPSLPKLTSPLIPFFRRAGLTKFLPHKTFMAVCPPASKRKSGKDVIFFKYFTQNQNFY